jgi:hypothetical protein
VSLSELLPGMDHALDEAHIKAAYLNAMPDLWREGYNRRYGHDVMDDDVKMRDIVL